MQRLIELLDDARQAAVARQARRRYPQETFETPQEWRVWFEKSRDRIYFSDIGGYKFFVVSEGYPVRPPPPRQP